MKHDYYERHEMQPIASEASPRLHQEALSLFSPIKSANASRTESFNDVDSLYFPSIYTGTIDADLRPQDVAQEEGEQNLEGAKALRPSDTSRREGQFTDENKQGQWTKATEKYRTSNRHSATHECLTDEQIADLERRGLGQKFEITGLTGPGNGSAEDTGRVTDYKPQEVIKNASFCARYELRRGSRYTLCLPKIK